MKEYGVRLVPEKYPPQENETPEQWLTRLKLNNTAALHHGIEQGWWDAVENDKPIKYIQLIYKTDQTFAHIFSAAKLFSSIGEAKRAGWNKPATNGTYKIGKQTVVVNFDLAQ
jgi:hypothetical protein